MRNGKGQVGSPSLTQPGLLKARRRLQKAEKATKPQPSRGMKFAIEDGQQVEVKREKSGPKPRPPQPRTITVTLQVRHSVNGRYYGPGQVTVSEEKARTFLNTEYIAADKELSLVQQRAFIIGFHNGVPVRREVPAQQFDTILQREELPLTNMGGR